MSSYENVGPEPEKPPTEDQIKTMMEKGVAFRAPATVRQMVDDLKYLYLMAEVGILLLMVRQGSILWDDFAAAKRLDSCLDAVSIVLLAFLFLGTIGRSHKYRVWLDATAPKGKKR